MRRMRKREIKSKKKKEIHIVNGISLQESSEE